MKVIGTLLFVSVSIMYFTNCTDIEFDTQSELGISMQECYCKSQTDDFHGDGWQICQKKLDAQMYLLATINCQKKSFNKLPIKGLVGGILYEEIHNKKGYYKSQLQTDVETSIVLTDDSILYFFKVAK